MESRARAITGLSVANLLTFSRFAAAGVFLFVAIEMPRHDVLGLIALIAAASDVIDGQVARRSHTASTRGHWLDSFADIAFVLTALAWEASAGAIAWYIPTLIAIAFAQYAIDSWIFAGADRAPIRSRIGHWGGIVNYAITIVLAFAPPPAWPGALVNRIAPVIALFYIAGMIERAIRYRRR